MLNILLSPQLFFLILINLILLFYRKKLYFLINIQDNPDGSLKIHKSKTHSIGGIIFYINIIIFFLQDYLFNNNSIFFNKEHLLETLVLLFSLSFMFLIGLYDDKYFLSYKIKFLLLLLVIIPCLIVDKNLIINNISFTFTDKNFYLDYLSIPFTILCIMLFINALNLFDGIDLQVGTYILFLSLYFIFELKLLYFIPVFVACIFFLYLNFKKEIFLGDSGSILIGFLISYFCIKSSQINLIKSDQIFIIMMLPGIDMFRLFLVRLLNKKNPFKGDRNHLHHIMIANFGYLNSFIFIQLLIFVPLLLMIFTEISSLIIILFTLLIYFYLIFFKKIKT